MPYRTNVKQLTNFLDGFIDFSLILNGLSEERKASNSGVQVLNVIRQRPKTRVEFSFRS